MKKSTFSCIDMKKMLLMSFLILTGQTAEAFDSEGYYWYRNHVTAYPTGAGQVYGTYSDEDYEYDDETNTFTPHDELFTDEVMVQACQESSEEVFYVFNKPAEGYNFNGWYYLNEDGELGNLITADENALDPFSLAKNLDYYHSDDNETDYYDEAPVNEIAGVFGRVNTKVTFDNWEEAVALYDKYHSIKKEEEVEELDAEEALRFIVVFGFDDSLNPSISNPANEVGDMLVLQTEQEHIVYISDKESYEESGEDNKVELIRSVFAKWTDAKGNSYDSNPLELKVTEKDTYTAHYNLILNEDYLRDNTTSVSGIIAKRPHSSVTYDLSGRAVGQRRQQGGIYICDGKKSVIPRGTDMHTLIPKE